MNKVGKRMLLKFSQLEPEELYKGLSTLDWSKYSYTKEAHATLISNKTEVAAFEALYKMHTGTWPAVNVITFNIRIRGKTRTIYRDGSHRAGEKSVEEDDVVKRAEKAIENVLAALGRTSYGGVDPKELERIQKEHEEEVENKIKDIERLSKANKDITEDLKVTTKKEESMRVKLEEVLLKPTISLEPVVGDGTIPDGSVEWRKVSEIFPSVQWGKDYDVPVWVWDGVHPVVPTVDENYIFRKEELQRVLFSILTNQRCYLQGHTGSGKTTLVEQVAAALKFPFVCLNLDSEMSRMDLVGREVLTTDDKTGNTISKFVDGIIPKAMSAPCILCCDEIDFVRPDVAYVMQRLFEGNAFTVAEDGGRVIHPDPNFRLFATGNTVGQGDEMGMYQGARIQSIAMLDRFTVWIKVNYMTDRERESLICKATPTLQAAALGMLNKYVKEHLAAFQEGNVLQPISPRGFLSIANGCIQLSRMNGKTHTDNLRTALTMSVLDRASSVDKVTLTEIVQRTVK